MVRNIMRGFDVPLSERDQCMCTWTPVSEVCPNYEVVGLQHWTMNPPHLGSVNIFKLKLALLPHLFLTFVWIFILTPPSYSPPICIRSLYSYSLICTCYPPPLPAQSVSHIQYVQNYVTHDKILDIDWCYSWTSLCFQVPNNSGSGIVIPVSRASEIICPLF